MKALSAATLLSSALPRWICEIWCIWTAAAVGGARKPALASFASLAVPTPAISAAADLLFSERRAAAVAANTPCAGDNTPRVSSFALQHVNMK